MWSRLRALWGVLLRPARAERDLADEVAFHLASRTDYWRTQGLSPAEAARRARLEFGGIEGYKDVCRDSRRPRLLQEVGADLTYGVRQLRAAPAFSLVAVGILAIAIGANTAVFSVLDAVLLRVLPVERPGELRELAWTARREGGWPMTYDGSMRPFGNGDLLATSFSYPIYAHLRDQSTTFADLFLFTRDEINLGVGGREHRVSALLVSGNFFRGLGVTTRIGHPMGVADDRAGAPAVAVLTSRVWQRLFGGDAAAVGSTVRINGVPASIAGVTPPAFEGVEPGWPVDVVLPITTLLPIVDDGPNRFGDSRWAFRVMGRVKPGVDDARVHAESEALFRQALPAGASYTPRLLVTPGGQGLDSLRRNYAEPLWLLMAIMAVVLLIACANIAGLLLMRAASREREMAVRLVLGAGRGRLLRQLLAETLLLAAIGGVLGTGLARAIAGGLLPVLNQDNEPIDLALGLGPWALAFSMGICVTVGLLCGILPALRATRAGARLTVARATPGGHDPSRLAAGKTLIALQVALSLVLLVGAGLFARSLANLRAQPLGFQPDHVMLFQFDATDAGYTGARLHDFYERVLERVAAIPGVQAVSMSRYGLLSGGATRDGVLVQTPGGPVDVSTHLHFVSARHFATMGIPLLSGRDLTPQDREGAPLVAVVNRALAERLPANAPAVGQRLGYGQKGAPLEIVGVVADARFASLREPPPPTLYLPYRQHPQHRMTFAVRVAGEPTSIVEAARRASEAVDPAVPMYEVRTQEAQIDAAVRQERLFAYVAGGFAALALVLACLGIYGTLGYSVARRTAEIGLRMALGANRAAVVLMVLRESITPVLLGVAVGLAAAWASTRLIEGMLFNLAPRDTATLVVATTVLVLAALVAAWVPARRASVVDPMTALRRE
jgi:predicted permease